MQKIASTTSCHGRRGGFASTLAHALERKRLFKNAHGREWRQSLHDARATKLSILLFLSWSSSAIAQTGIEALLEPWEPNQHFEADSDLRLFAKGHEKESGSHIQLSQIDSQGRYRLDDSRPINPTLSYEASYLHIGAPHLPDQLTDVAVGFSSPIAGDENLFLAGAAALGYAGAEPFDNSRGLYAQATAVVGHAFDDSRTLLFVLDYDGNRTLFPDIPIPAVEYIDQSNPNFVFVLGLPVDIIYWKPAPEFEVSLNFEVPESYAIEADYHPEKHWTIYLTAGDNSNRYAVDDLGRNRRLIFQQTRIGAGISYQPIKNVEFTLGAGYAFAQRFAVGFDERRLRDKIDLTDEPYLRIGVDINW
jgi:hypothetical protein